MLKTSKAWNGFITICTLTKEAVIVRWLADVPADPWPFVQTRHTFVAQWHTYLSALYPWPFVQTKCTFVANTLACQLADPWLFIQTKRTFVAQWSAHLPVSSVIMSLNPHKGRDFFFFKLYPNFQMDTLINMYQEMFWRVRASGMIFTILPIECQFVYLKKCWLTLTCCKIWKSIVQFFFFLTFVFNNQTITFCPLINSIFVEDESG